MKRFVLALLLIILAVILVGCSTPPMFEPEQATYLLGQTKEDIFEIMKLKEKDYKETKSYQLEREYILGDKTFQLEAGSLHHYEIPNHYKILGVVGNVNLEFMNNNLVYLGLNSNFETASDGFNQVKAYCDTIKSLYGEPLDNPTDKRLCNLSQFSDMAHSEYDVINYFDTWLVGGKTEVSIVVGYYHEGNLKLSIEYKQLAKK